MNANDCTNALHARFLEHLDDLKHGRISRADYARRVVALFEAARAEGHAVRTAFDRLMADDGLMTDEPPGPRSLIG